VSNVIAIDKRLPYIEKFVIQLILFAPYSFQNNKQRKCTDDPDLSLKISILQNELAEVLEANDMYKMQLKR